MGKGKVASEDSDKGSWTKPHGTIKTSVRRWDIIQYSDKVLGE
jgi:hypothetical protein